MDRNSDDVRLVRYVERKERETKKANGKRRLEDDMEDQSHAKVAKTGPVEVEDDEIVLIA
jgi:hypothetical protein